MEFLLIIVGAVAVYLIAAYFKRLWPFKAKGVAPTPAVYWPEPQKKPCVIAAHILPDAVTNGIQAAFTERIATAKARGWTNNLDPAIYTVKVLPATRTHDSDGNYAPSFAVPFGAGDPYDESIYDQQPNTPGGYLNAAEQVEIKNGKPTNVFMIADNDSAEYTKTAVSNGLDHLFAWYNDRALYHATENHANGSAHPLW